MIQCRDQSNCLIETPLGLKPGFELSSQCTRRPQKDGFTAQHLGLDMGQPILCRGWTEPDFNTWSSFLCNMFLSSRASWESNTTLVSFIFFSAATHHLKYKALEIIKVVNSELGTGRFRWLVIKMFSNCPMLVEHFILCIHVSQVVLQALDGPGLVESKHGLHALGSVWTACGWVTLWDHQDSSSSNPEGGFWFCSS